MAEPLLVEVLGLEGAAATEAAATTRLATEGVEVVGATRASSTAGELSGPAKTYQTYTKTNSTTGEVYSGRTSGVKSPEKNIEARDKNHHMSGKGYGPAKLDKSSSNADAIRGREQEVIEKNGGAKSQGGTSGNARNGISDKNPKKDEYMQAAKKEFENH